VAQYVCCGSLNSLSPNSMAVANAKSPSKGPAKSLHPVKLFISIAATYLIATVALAVPLSVGTTGSPLIMDAGTTAGGGVNIVNTTSSDSPADFLTSWQVRLIVKPDIGFSTGSLRFASANQPGTNYLLDPLSATLGVTTIPGPLPLPSEVLLVIDSELVFPLTGVQVPDGVGANLLDLSFFASGNASGAFGIFLDQSFPNSVWTDQGNPTINRIFANTPDTLDDTGQLTLARIGTVEVIAAPFTPGGIPEPLTAMLGVLSLGALSVTVMRRQRSCGAQ